MANDQPPSRRGPVYQLLPLKTKTSQLLRRILGWAQASIDDYFKPFTSEGKAGWIAWLSVVVYFLVGAIGWSYILNWGEFPLDFHDWAAGTGHRLAYLKNAVLEGALPLHMPDGSALRNVTDRFIATPDTILSPQVLLLRFLGLSEFVLANTLLLYTAGFIGLLVLARRMAWSPFTLGVVFFLFSFNGHITDHVIVGHMHWVAYFLFPFTFLLLLDLVETQVGWTWVLKWSLLMVVVFLQGGVHLFTMSLVFLGLTIPAASYNWKMIVWGILFSLLLNLFRILPAGLESGRFDLDFLAGFETSGGLVESMVSLKLPVGEQVFSASPLRPLGWWEYDYFIGIVGTLFLIWAVLKATGLAKESPLRKRWRLLVPGLAMVLLSIGQIYEPINALDLPLVSSQRVATRFFMVPLLTLIFLGAELLTYELARKSNDTWLWKLGALAAFAIMVNDLWQHTKLWRIRWMLQLFDRLPVDFTAEHVANHPDPTYIGAIVSGGLIALLAVGFLLWKMRSSRTSTR